MTETTAYNEDGNVASKTRTENGKETTYTYAYKNNAAKDLESVSVGEVTILPQSDCLGRSTGKTIEFAGTTIAEESITYRKVGDHATNMPSTVRFGNRIAAPVTPSNDATDPSVTPSNDATDPSVISTEHEVRAEKSQTEAEGSQSQFVRLDNLKYTYDACGNITEVRENGSLAVRYTYDALNRLVREDNKQLGKTWLYSYDNNGNILSKRELSFTLCGKEKLEELDGTETLYAYDGDRLLAFGSELFKYDVLGNPTFYRGKTCKWSNGRQLTKFDTTTFKYDGQGRRTEKHTTRVVCDSEENPSEQNVDIAFTYNSEGKLIRQSNGLSFIYDHSGVVGFEYDNSTYFYRRNVQGDIIAILDNSGAVVVKYIYDAWGNHAVKVLDSAYTALSELNPFRYRGYYYDPETGLYYLKTRYYDPEIGRFITIDDLSYLDPETINGLNLYAYCGNNPVMFTDPEGTTKWWEWLVAGLIVAACIVGAVFTGGTSLIGAAFMGAAIGGGISLLSQGINYAVTGTDFSWGKFALDLGVGALSGAIGASGITRVGSTLCGIGIGGASDFASQLIGGASIGEIDWLSVGLSAAIGGLAGWLSGAGAKNRAKMDMSISRNAAVKSAQTSVAKVGDRLANGFYTTARGAKSAYTQAMNRMSQAIFKAAHSYSVGAVRSAMIALASSTIVTTGIGHIRKRFGW